MSWLDYQQYTGTSPHSVVGTLQALVGVSSPQLDNQRDLLVYLPPSYGQGEGRYPVIYMHDGQNLFDHATSYCGEWEVDETMEGLSGEGLEAIVVGIPNLGVERLNEYSPFVDPRLGGGRGDDYLAFVVETIKPLIDRDFRTLPERRHTGIIGSSMGGLISLYAFFRHSETFGFAGVMSPSLWFSRQAIFDYIREAPFTAGKLYLDIGTNECSDSLLDRLSMRGRSRHFHENIRQMYLLLREKGYRTGHDLRYLEEWGAIHHESAWARRLHTALRFLL
jgi:predicted alpha/beta superfamily hydrolase